MFNRNKTSEMIVKPAYSPRVKMTVAAVIAIIVVVAGASMYNYGLSTAGFQRFSASKTEDDLKLQIEQLEKDNQQLRGGLARAERTLQMDQAAYKDLNRSLKVSSNELVKLKEDLDFYRNIISPVNKKSGLRIQSLDIDKTLKKNIYTYKLVLIQALKHDRVVHGKVRLEVNGLQLGQQMALSIPAAGKKAAVVNFRYFQEFAGEIELPPGFDAREVKVKVTTRGSGAQTLTRKYTWPQA